jgi:hypothetical protein
MDNCKICYIGITPYQAVMFDGCCKKEHARLLEKFDIQAYCKALIEVHLLKKELRKKSRRNHFR